MMTLAEREIWRTVLMHRFPQPTRCNLSPRCQSEAAYVAEIHFERGYRPAFMTKPACSHHAKKFAAKFDLPFPLGA